MNAFAFLLNEIINDVLIIAGDKQHLISKARIHHQFLIPLNGPWGNFARDATPVTVEFCENLPAICLASSNKKLTFEEAIQRPISSCAIYYSTESEQLRQIAPNFYESIEICYSPNLSRCVLDRLGDRFSSVCLGTSGGKTSDDVLEFFKRQLRSNYLRNFSINLVDLREFNSLFVDFVQKPTFESLSCSECVSLCAQVVIEADKAWNAMKTFEVGFQIVSGTLIGRDAEELMEYFGTAGNGNKTCSEVVKCHPVTNSAKMLFNMYWTTAKKLIFTMKFFNFEHL